MFVKGLGKEYVNVNLVDGLVGRLKVEIFCVVCGGELVGNMFVFNDIDWFYIKLWSEVCIRIICE